MSLNGRCHDCDGPTTEYRCKRCALMRRHGLTEREADEVLAHRAKVVADREAARAAAEAKRLAAQARDNETRRSRLKSCHPLFGWGRGSSLRETLSLLEETLRDDARGGWITFEAWATRLGYDDLRGRRQAGFTTPARRRWDRFLARLRDAGIEVELPVNDGLTRASFRLTRDGRDRFEALLGAYVKWLAARAS